MTNERIAIFDSLDTIQGYRGAQPGKHKDFYLGRVAAKHGLTVESMLKETPAETYLQWTAEMIKDGELVPTMLPGAEKLISQYKSMGLKPIIVTADIPEAARLTSRPFTESGLIKVTDVHAILDIGSKKKAETWLKAQAQRFPGTQVNTVFEDTPDNLHGAVVAYKTHGFLVKEGPSGLSLVQHIDYGSP